MLENGPVLIEDTCFCFNASKGLRGRYSFAIVHAVKASIIEHDTIFIWMRQNFTGPYMFLHISMVMLFTLENMIATSSKMVEWSRAEMQMLRSQFQKLQL